MLPDQAGLGEFPGDDLGVGHFLVVVEDELAARRADGERRIDAQAPAGDVDAVDAVVAQLAGAPVPEPVPVVVKSVRVKRPVGRGPLPHRVVDAGGNVGRMPVADVHSLLMTPGPGHADLADAARLDVFDRFLNVRRAPPLGSDLDDALVLARRLDHPPAFDDVVAGRLLDVDILAGLAGQHGQQRVPVVGRGDRDGVDRLVVEQRRKSFSVRGALPVAASTALTGFANIASSTSQTATTSACGFAANILACSVPRLRKPMTATRTRSFALASTVRPPMRPTAAAPAPMNVRRLHDSRMVSYLAGRLECDLAIGYRSGTERLQGRDGAGMKARREAHCRGVRRFALAAGFRSA